MKQRQYQHGKAVKTLIAQDGKREIDIVARNDGTFQYCAHFVDGLGWCPEPPSGLFSTFEGAEAAARSEGEL